MTLFLQLESEFSVQFQSVPTRTVGVRIPRQCQGSFIVNFTAASHTKKNVTSVSCTYETVFQQYLSVVIHSTTHLQYQLIQLNLATNKGRCLEIINATDGFFVPCTEVLELSSAQRYHSVRSSPSVSHQRYRAMK